MTKILEFRSLVLYQRLNSKHKWLGKGYKEITEWVVSVSVNLKGEIGYSVMYSGKTKRAAFKKFNKHFYKDLLKTFGEFDGIKDYDPSDFGWIRNPKRDWWKEN